MGDKYNWWEEGRYNPWDENESIWRNTNMIWIVPVCIWVGGMAAVAIAVATAAVLCGR